MKNVRLSKEIVPTRYDIQLRPDLENFTFEGMETITLDILQKTKTLTLHSKELEIETVEVIIKDGKMFGKISYDEKSETATFNFANHLPKKAKLTVVFKGILNDKMRGFYRSSHTTNGKEYKIATTQFEATDARRAFPCFDEPAHKAVFHVSLIIPKNKIAISNTLPIAVFEHEAGLQIIKFAPTPKMSTYLLAFIIGDFEYLESKTKSGVKVRIYTTPGKKHQGAFALDVTVKVLEFYEKYFNIPYPLNTLDMIAIPDFTSLAMENWGAITFREIGLLFDEKHTSTESKEMIAEVIAHELAHQWFGNLVTMEWWTHLWLNEGFASYIPYLAIDTLFPEWNIWERFTTDTLGIALRLDALKNTHPVEIEVHHPNDIGEIFDAVSYSKGASIIRMLADYLGEKDFRDGLRYYLKKHSYKNTETIHLWQAFQKVSKKPVTKMMHYWTSKSGYPVVKASLKNNKLHLSQERFFMSPVSKKKNKERTVWPIPVSVGNSTQVQFRRDISQRDGARIAKNQQIFMRVEKKSVPSKNFDLQKFWVKINSGETGFFRTAYSKELLMKLVEPVKNKILPPSDRLGIIRDLFALAEAGTIPTTDALEFLSAYKHEDSYIVWIEIATGFARLEQILVPPKARHLRPEKNNALDKFILELFSPLFARLGWEKKKDEPHSHTLLRTLTISRLARSSHHEIVKELRKKFSNMQRGGHVNPDTRNAIYGVIARTGGMKEYKMFIQKYKKEVMHEEKNRLGHALGDFKNPKILALACKFAFSKDVRPQDTVGIISSVGANPLGRDVWWSFVTKNWKTLVSRYGDGGHTLSRLVKAIAGSAEEKHLKAFRTFFKTHDAPGATRSIEQVMERLEGNIAWLKRDKKVIEKFLNK